MRPTKLTMTAFGPFASTVEVDFTKFDGRGLFLIAGETGSGKTSIFDGICFALYGEASGENREKEDLRSRHADKDVLTEVQLEFIDKGNCYKIVRQPKQLKPSKRTESGYTDSAASVKLYLPNGVILTREADNKIQEIVGLNQKQFRQIVMIAQGDFQRLISEKTDARQAILRSIFKTDFYVQFTDKLKDKYAIFDEKVKLQEALLETQIASLADENINRENIVDNIKERIKKEIIDESNAKEKITEITKILLEKDKELDKLNSLKEKKKQYNQLENDFIKTNSHIKEAKEKNDKLLGQSSMYDDNTKRATLLESNLSQYDKLEEIIKQKKLNDDNVTKLSKDENNLKKLLEAEEKETVKYQSELKILENVEQDVIKKSKEATDQNNKVNVLSDLSKLNDEIKYREKDLSLKQERYQKEKEEYSILYQEYETINQNFLDEQAGILAEKLDDDKPCPVCGSLHHPNPAKVKLVGLSEEKVKKARNLFEQADKKMRESSELASSSKKVLEQLKQQYLSNLAKNGLEDNCDIDENLKRSQELLSSYKMGLEKVQEDQKRKKDLTFKLEKANKNIDEYKNSLVEVQKQLSVANNNVNIYDNQLNEIKKGLEFKDKNEAISALNEVKLSLNKYKSDLEKSKNELNDLEKRASSFKAQMDLLTNELKNYNESDRDILEKMIFENQKKKEDLEKDYQLVNRNLKNHQDMLKTVEKILKEIQYLEDKINILKPLKETADGKVKGKDKISLETYVQMHYFDRIIRRANVHFVKMSDGQYELIRKEESKAGNAKDGLELCVIDHYNGSIGNATSLSGGESFEASLSLALGLSEEIQASVGGIKMESMFIDEGFGTLDQTVLRKAVEVLNSLATGNKLVGVISHVEQLKESLDNQLVVTKIGGNSKIDIIV